MKLGIVGLPNVGKSTLFNAITQAGAEAANYPFCTIEPNVGVVSVPDSRLKVLRDMYDSKKIVPTAIEFYDIAGLVKGASKGEGLGNKFLAHIREVAAIVHVVRCFDDPNVVHVDGSIDPIRDIETINLELILSDAEMISRRLEKTRKAAKADKTLQKEMELLTEISELLNEGRSARTMELDQDSEKFVKSLDMLSYKPIIYAANISEDDLLDDGSHNAYVEKVREFASTEDAEVITFCAKIEEELSDLDDEERQDFLSELGITEAGLDKLVRACYHLLDLISFLTAGPQEIRAWTIRRGTKAPQAAGKIHSDIERGFIRAETIHFDHLIEAGSMAAAKEKGNVRLEGKEYLVKDGDVILFRFNV
ncbi:MULTISPECIES: redox-regulated ATPase YchF [unclassified Fusibacter]|uniref:redox-regulated ATPase YchF n=1 Tax=unclassified Fusibacter TaxID=2624464 RepID=UPI00101337DA|nr:MULTISPECIES: redox-regulated ATPase YchF [unclassified Fusibacter]MCK8061335.1 redox-regulated ATPase YchF [Fusibacter sp. A2]NPE23468.1 redox-regulated ATPase YchF [Fusibacter sp. A1]RXV59074.1 redox-regulated ATPase YchF [Fusibacter sp. A1]